MDSRPTIGRFVVEGELGHGGSGRVLAAWDPVLERRVALKRLEVRDEAEVRERFLREARIGARLEHPGIVPVHEIGWSDGEPFVVLRCVVGLTLADAVHRAFAADGAGPWTRRRLLRAFVQVAEAAGFAHRRGIVHRDLKPENVMLGETGEVQILDFGLAHLVGDEPPGDLAGTPGMMSPEQVHGGALGPASDVWSLGAVLHEVLTGRPAFPGADAHERIARTAVPILPPLDGLDPDLAAILARCFRADPADRFPDGAALAEAMYAWDSGAERRRRAEEALAGADEALADQQAALGVRRALATEVERGQSSVGHSAADADSPEKRALDALCERFEEAGERASLRFADALAAGEAALAHDPGNRRARRVLAHAWWNRLADAEASGLVHELPLLEGRVAAYDDERRLRTPTVTLDTAPSGARVLAREVDRRGLVWALGPPRELGRTPLDRAPLPRGSWVLALEVEGRPPVTYPVIVGASQDWEAEAPVPIPEEIPDGWVYVPGGPFLRGGDQTLTQSRPRERATVAGFLAAIFPVTAAEYAAFLRAVAARDPAEAAARAPREGRVPHWPAPPDGVAWEVPERDADGTRWRPDWPILGVSWHDAAAYAAWAGARLPTRLEWEKLARGVDGRTFVWGNRYGGSLLVNRAYVFAQGEPSARPVGHKPTDRSVYGARDLAGSMCAWCDGDGPRKPVCGNSWGGGPSESRISSVSFRDPSSATSGVGLRLVRDLPGGG